MELTINDKAYFVERLLGKGKGGYSYLVSDGAGEYVIKQIHHEPCDYYRFGDKLASERRDYARLKAIGIPMPELLAVDEAGERILKAYIPGDTIDRYVMCWPIGWRKAFIDRLRPCAVCCIRRIPISTIFPQTLSSGTGCFSM